TDSEVIEIGVFRPFAAAVEELGPGEVGFVAANIKSVHDVKLGDTVTHAVSAPGRGPHHLGPTSEPLPGFKEVKPMGFAGVSPPDGAASPQRRDAMEKLHLNDAAFTFEPDASEALGFGFRCGF